MKNKGILYIGFGIILLMSVSIFGLEDRIPSESGNPEDYTYGIRIMCLGNSLTEHDRIGWKHKSYLDKRHAYRSELYWLLRWGDYRGGGRLHNVNFVGGERNGSQITTYMDDDDVYFDTDHQGYSGAPSFDLTPKIETWLKEEDPDIILLHIGTNDLAEGGYNKSAEDTKENLRQLLTEIKNVNKNVVTLVAKTLNVRSNRINLNNKISDYNSKVSTMIDKDFTSTNENGARHFVHIDMPNLGDDYFTQKDPFHPSDEGFAKMAEAWWEALEDEYTIVDFENTQEPQNRCRLKVKIFGKNGGSFKLPAKNECGRSIKSYGTCNGLQYPGQNCNVSPGHHTFDVYYRY